MKLTPLINYILFRILRNNKFCNQYTYIVPIIEYLADCRMIKLIKSRINLLFCLKIFDFYAIFYLSIIYLKC